MGHAFRTRFCLCRTRSLGRLFLTLNNHFLAGEGRTRYDSRWAAEEHKGMFTLMLSGAAAVAVCAALEPHVVYRHLQVKVGG